MPGQPASLDSDLSFIPEAVVAGTASARDGGGSGFPQLAGMAWSQDCSHGSCVQAVPAGSEYGPLQYHPRVLGALTEHLLCARTNAFAAPDTAHKLHKVAT